MNQLALLDMEEMHASETSYFELLDCYFFNSPLFSMCSDHGSEFLVSNFVFFKLS